MKLSEIAECVVKDYPDCSMVRNNDIRIGCREDWYEEYLIDKLMDFFSYEILGLCSCGCPADTNEVIRRTLNVRFELIKDKLEYEIVKQRYNGELKLDINDNIHYGILQFVLYILDSCGIVEHGSSIGGCWLTELGKMYLTVLNAWHIQREDSENKN